MSEEDFRVEAIRLLADILNVLKNIESNTNQEVV